MKFFLLLFVQIFVFFFLANSQVTFQKNFFLNIRDKHYSDFITFPDGSTMIIGQALFHAYQTSNRDYRILCVKFDKAGNIIFSKYFTSKYSEHYPKAVIAEDGGFYIVSGKSYDKRSNTYNGFLVIRCDSSGNAIWSKRYSSDWFAYSEPQIIAIDKQENIYIEFSVGRGLKFACINKKGDPLWANYIDPDIWFLPDDYFCTHLYVYNDNIYVGGGAACRDCGETTINAFLLKMQKNGNPIYLKEFDIDQRWHNTFIEKVYFQNDKLYLWGCRDDKYFTLPVNEDSNNTSMIWCTAYEMEKNFFFKQYYLSKNKSVRKLFKDFFTDGSFISMGPYFTAYRYDLEGRICPAYTKPSFDSTILKTQYLTWNELFFYYTDTLSVKNEKVSDTAMINESEICRGKAGATNSFLESNKIRGLQNELLTIKPNPANNFIHVSFQSNNATSEFVYLCDLNGSILFKSDIKSLYDKNSLVIDVSFLTQGFYFIKLVTESKVFTKKFYKL